MYTAVPSLVRPANRACLPGSAVWPRFASIAPDTSVGEENRRPASAACLASPSVGEGDWCAVLASCSVPVPVFSIKRSSQAKLGMPSTPRTPPPHTSHLSAICYAQSTGASLHTHAPTCLIPPAHQRWIVPCGAPRTRLGIDGEDTSQYRDLKGEAALAVRLPSCRLLPSGKEDSQLWV